MTGAGAVDTGTTVQGGGSETVRMAAWRAATRSTTAVCSTSSTAASGGQIDVFGSLDVSGIATNISGTIENGGLLTVSGAGAVDSITDVKSGGSAVVSANGMLKGTTVDLGATVNISSGGVGSGIDNFGAVTVAAGTNSAGYRRKRRRADGYRRGRLGRRHRHTHPEQRSRNRL